LPKVEFAAKERLEIVPEV